MTICANPGLKFYFAIVFNVLYISSIIMLCCCYWISYSWVKLPHPSRNRVHFSRVFQCAPPHTVFSSLFSYCSHINKPRTLPHIPATPLYSLCILIYPHALLHIPSTPLYCLCTPIFPRTLPHIPAIPLYCLCNPIYPRTLQHIPSTPLYRL